MSPNGAQSSGWRRTFHSGNNNKAEQDLRSVQMVKSIRNHMVAMDTDTLKMGEWRGSGMSGNIEVKCCIFLSPVMEEEKLRTQNVAKYLIGFYLSAKTSRRQ